MKNPRSIADYADAPGVHLLGREDAWMAYSVSGGKDSSAAIAATMPLLDSIGHPRERRFLLHADLGRSEWRSTHSHVEDLARHFGLPLHVVKHTTHDMVSRWERRGELGRERWAKGETVNLVGPWSSAGTRFCTSEMKIHVMSRFKRVYAEPVVSVMGIRRDESIGRSRAAFEAIDTGMKRYGRDDCMTWNPIADWSSEDVFAIHNTTGAPVTVTIETGNPTAGVCSADTGLHLLASDLSVVTTDDDGGPGFCSRIVWTIPAGVTYYAHVVEYGDNATIDPYQLSIDFP